MSETAAALKAELAVLTRELAESRAQQTATADVLKVISRSGFDLRSVLDTLVESAAHLCEAEMAGIARQRGTGFYYAAAHNFPDEFRQHIAAVSHQQDRGSVIGRTLIDGKVVHIPDVLADADYNQNVTQAKGRYRTVLGVPLLQHGSPTGVITLFRNTVQPFTAQQIELVTTFADQAVIAIENARLFEEVQARTLEVTESLEYQTATSDVLNVISRSPSAVEPVLEAIVTTAARLCAAEYTFVARCSETECRLVAANRIEAEHIQYLARNPVRIDRGSVTGRVALERATIHVPDVLADPEFRHLDWQRVGKQRTVLGVPLLRDGRLLGTIILARTEVKPFSDKQIELVTTFADQAVIAIENARLFEEVQARTAELQESLEYQTATSDVLNVISRSPSQIQPVLDTITETAGRLCDAYDVLIRLRDGELLTGAAHRGSIAADFGPLPIGRGWAMGRAFVDRKPVHVHDLLDSADEFPDGQAMARRLAVRTILATPLMRENEAIGAIAVRRAEVRPFSDKQVALLQTFADQAVIAIENARLFEEVQARTRELTTALEQQVATSEVLQVISRSKFDLQPVLDAIVESANRLCEGDGANIWRPRDGVYYSAASYGMPAEFTKRLDQITFRPGGRSIVARAVISRDT